MTLDKEQHRKFFLDLINQATFAGSAVDIVLELRSAVLSADTHSSAPRNGANGSLHDTKAPKPRDRAVS